VLQEKMLRHFGYSHRITEYASRSQAKHAKAVVLKREPLGSLREEFLIPGGKFAPGRNWEGKAVEKNVSFSSCWCNQHIKKLHSEVGLHGDVCSTQAQATLSSFEPVLSAYSLAALDRRASVEQPIDCLIQIRTCNA